MALIQNIVLESGVSVDGSYTRIELVNGNKEQITIGLCYYLNQSACESGRTPITQKYYDFIPSVTDGADNFIKQGYEYLKTLPEFSSAVDVLE